MRTDRPYRKALAYDVTVAELRSVSGTQLDPTLVEALLEIVASEAPEAQPAQPRCSRCATAAAWVRLRTPSLLRIRETWTLAVFSAMNSAAPI